jgi:hypothetical protein
MLKKIVFAAAAAAVVLGAGTAALAASGGSGSPSPSPSGSASAPAKPGPAAPGPAAPGAAAPGAAHRGPKADRPALRALGRALHAQWVTRERGNAGSFVTHDAIRGEVTAVSATSITVKAADGVSQTYAVTSDTKVHLRKNLPGPGKGRAHGQGGNGQPTAGAPAGTISDVHTGDKVAVTGTGTSSLTAQHIVAVTG